MQFKKFKARRVELKKANRKEIEEFNQQINTYKDVKDANFISNNPTDDFITIKEETGMQIGLIKVRQVNDESASIDISIPNEAWKYRYGTEAVHQFVKCCKQRELFKKLYMQENNSIIQAYRRERPELFKNENYIEIYE